MVVVVAVVYKLLSYLTIILFYVHSLKVSLTYKTTKYRVILSPKAHPSKRERERDREELHSKTTINREREETLESF